ncbi:unnamed protein product [Blumeria hordei]|uniref:Pentatricopeptide repeat-containing protein n=1 Tax=Blumeria hordei TaxID=2867405 RepID=A0A383USA6_BLUHO|nr:unnamed protein product [Blumeria hordei]
MSWFCTSKIPTSCPAKFGSRALHNYVELSSAGELTIRFRKTDCISKNDSIITENYEKWQALSIVNPVQNQSCSTKSSTSFTSTYRPNQNRFRSQKLRIEFLKFIHTKTAIKHGCEVANKYQLTDSPSKKELLELIDHYDGQNTEFIQSDLGCRSPYRHSETPKCKDHADTENDSYSNYKRLCNDGTNHILNNLKKALSIEPADLDDVYQLYRSLPNTRAEYLDCQTRHKLLHVLSVIEHKDENSMLRFLSVVDDLKSLGIPLSLSEWNSAISFIGGSTRRVTLKETQAALQMWRDMEETTNLKADDVTFNILFNVACRASKFSLAEMIYNQMDERGLQPDRYHHVSNIMYFGMKQHGDGVRAAYRRLIEAGEIVDTIVLNAMISALIKAREPNSAENLYQRMKQTHLSRTNPPLPPRSYTCRRAVNKVLKMATQLAKGDIQKRNDLQNKSIMAPDSITYLLLIEHFAVEEGNLEKTIIFLDEMKWFALPVHGAIFIKLFRGFYIHGGIPYTSWTGVRLEFVYNSFIEALNSEETDLFISGGIVFWVLKAFLRCTGNSRALSIWEQLKERWNPEPADLELLRPTLNQIIEQRSVPKRCIGS